METNNLIIFGNFIRFAIFIYIALLFIRILISWVNPNPNTPLMRVLSKIVDPTLYWAKKAFPVRIGIFDFSPVILILILTIISDVAKDGTNYLAQGSAVGVLLPVLTISVLNIVNIFIFWIILILTARLIILLVKANPYNKFVIVVFILSEPLIRFFNPYLGKLSQIIKTMVTALVFFAFQYLVLLYLINLSHKWAASYLTKIIS